MNVEIKVNGLELKVSYTDRKHVDRILKAAFAFEKGESFTDVYFSDNSPQQEKSEKKKESKNFTPEVDGVKDYGNGKLAYKCSYNCSGCNHKGVRYIKGDEEYVHCHECNEKLAVCASTPNELHDEDYNYFLAY